MKIALITDQHFGGKQDSQNFSNYIEVFYREQFFPYLSENNIYDIVDLGDTFDRRKFVNFNTLNQVRQFYFDTLYDRGIKLHSITETQTLLIALIYFMDIMKMLAHIHHQKRYVLMKHLLIYCRGLIQRIMMKP